MKRKNKKNKPNILKIIFIFFIIILLISLFLFNVLQQRLVPIIENLSTTHGKSIINNSINLTISKIVENNKIIQSDFYTLNTDDNNNVTSIEINTLLINSICGALSENVLNSLENESNKTLVIPFSSMVNAPLINNLGPNIPINMVPIGNVDTNYETSFSEAGINQTTFEMWINLDITMQVVNPINTIKIHITRKIPIVTTIINGNVPSYFGNIYGDSFQ